MSRTTCSTEKPSVSRVNLSAVSHTLRAALDRARTSMPMPLCWMPCPGNAYTVLGASNCAVADITRSDADLRAVTSTISAPRSIPTRSTRKSTLVTRQHHAEEAGGPADQAGRRSGLLRR